jgi:hypothetical protein
MKLQQILVYDKQHYFFRFLKNQFEENFEFKKITKLEKLKDLSKYPIVVFVMYNEAELFDFMNMYIADIHVLVCTFNKNILHKIKITSNISLLDTSKTKIEMEKELRVFFKSLVVHKHIIT